MLGSEAQQQPPRLPLSSQSHGPGLRPSLGPGERALLLPSFVIGIDRFVQLNSMIYSSPVSNCNFPVPSENRRWVSLRFHTPWRMRFPCALLARALQADWPVSRRGEKNPIAKDCKADWKCVIPNACEISLSDPPSLPHSYPQGGRVLLAFQALGVGRKSGEGLGERVALL